MSRSRREKRRRTAIGRRVDLFLCFVLGFLVSSFLGLGVTWVLGIAVHQHGEVHRHADGHRHRSPPHPPVDVRR